VEAASESARAALRGAGFEVEAPEEDVEQAVIFPELGQGLAEWTVTLRRSGVWKSDSCRPAWPTLALVPVQLVDGKDAYHSWNRLAETG
jgi:hypothetical protein